MQVGYARISTGDQDLTLQVNALQEAGCEKIFTEKASGAQRDRPELKAALEFMRKGDILVVWKLDRLARSLKQLIETIEHLDERGIQFSSLTETMDTTTSGGRLFYHIFAALSEFERSIIRERTRAGLEAARRMGKVSGRPCALSPRDLIEAKAMLKDKTITIAQIAKRFNISESTFYRYIPGGRHEIDSEQNG
jgi:DNA invertase Pin-like site-specific DNA recombinase